MNKGDEMKKIKLYRLMAEKTQKQLAKETGCSQSLISLFETGKVIPGKSLREVIAKTLNRTEEEIFPGESGRI